MGWKHEKTKEEERTHPGEEFYEELFTQDTIMEEVSSFYGDLYQHQTTNPDYDQIIIAFGQVP